jgi:hypothetical protein
MTGAWGPIPTSYGIMIAGDGYACAPYSYPDNVQLGENCTWLNRFRLLRVDSSGNSDNIDVMDFPSRCTGDNCPPWDVSMITNADQGILLTWDDYDFNGHMAIVAGGSVSGMSGPVAPGQTGNVNPILQAQDGSYIGMVYTGPNALNMIAFDASGGVRWMVPGNYQPQIATADGGLIATDQDTGAELADLYRRIGAALWHLQYLEDVLVSFLVMKIIHERRCAGRTVTASDAQTLFADKRRIALGPLIEACSSRKIIRPEHQARFEAFKNERHWLVHRSLVESGDELYDDATRNSVVSRIATIQQEASSLKGLVVSDFESWGAAHGVDLDACPRASGRRHAQAQGRLTAPSCGLLVPAGDPIWPVRPGKSGSGKPRSNRGARESPPLSQLKPRATC